MDVKKPLIEANDQAGANRVQISSRSPSIIQSQTPLQTEMTFSSAPLPPAHEEGHELQRRNSKGFQKLNSNEPSRSGTPQNANYYSPPPGQPYYGSPPPGQPYYGPPPGSQPYYGQPQYPLIQTLEVLPPRGYDRPLYLRLLIGPIQTPIFSYISALAMAAMLIYEFVKYHNLTGGVIQTSPFNPMIGPSFQVRKVKPWTFIVLLIPL